MKHIIELDARDLNQLFGAGLDLPAGESALLRARRADAPEQNGKPDVTVHLTPKNASFACEKCGREFTSAKGKNRHLASCKAGANGHKSNGRIYECQEHHKTFTTRQGLNVHNRKKHKAGGSGFEFECTDDACAMTFPTPSARDRHMRKEHGD